MAKILKHISSLSLWVKGLKCRGTMENSEEGLVLKPQEESLTPDLAVAPYYTPKDVPSTMEALVGEFQNLRLEENNNNNDNKDDKDNTNENVDGETLVKEENSRNPQYPQKLEAADCLYFLRTGTCGYGSNCRYNHPAWRKDQVQNSVSPEAVQVIMENDMGNDESSETAWQQECKYYLRAGGCKFGKACRYNHPQEKMAVAPPIDFNFLGLPIRPGEKECPYYMRTGYCKYGTNCRFHHPDPTPVGVDPFTGNHSTGSVSQPSSGESQPTLTSWSSRTTLNETVSYLDASSYVPMMFPSLQGVSLNPEWNGYQAPLHPPESSIHTPPAVILNNSTNRTDVSMLEEFPERTGQAEYSYFMKNGDCKYRSACKYHHPKNRVTESPVCVLSPRGLPLRPNQNICTHYNRYGICKFGPACKFDHPVNYVSSVPSAVSTLI